MTGGVYGGRQEPSNKTTKEVYGQFVPKSAIGDAVKYSLRNEFEKGMRGCQVEETISLVGCDHLGASLDQSRPIVAQQRP